MPRSKLELVLVNVFHRHGERAPLKTYEKPLGRIEACHKNSLIFQTIPPKKSFFASLFTFNNQPLNFELIYKKIPTGECAPGQLTDIGKKRLFDFGRRLKDKYVENGLLSAYFNSNEVYFASTDYQRTIESLQSLIKGLFKKCDESIPIHIWRRGVNSPYSYQYSPDFLKISAKHKKEMTIKHEKAISQINEYILRNFPVLSISKNPAEIIDIIYSNLGNNIRYFRNFRNFSPKILALAEKISLDMNYELLGKEENLINYSGGIFKDLYERLKGVENGKINYKMFITSGHDTTIYPILMALKIHDEKWPGFGSNIIIETYKDENNKFYVKVKHNEKIKTLPDCFFDNNDKNKLCPLEDFLHNLKQYVPNNNGKSCNYLE